MEIQLFLDIEANPSKWEDHDRKQLVHKWSVYEILTMSNCCCAYFYRDSFQNYHLQQIYHLPYAHRIFINIIKLKKKIKLWNNGIEWSNLWLLYIVLIILLCKVMIGLIWVELHPPHTIALYDKYGCTKSIMKMYTSW